jgi:hypothetical protein
MDNNTEIWKEVVGYEGLYWISNFARLKNRLGYISNGYLHNKHGYKKVRLYKNRIKKDLFLHRVVAMAFIENPYNKPVINHIDHNPSNNCVDNLEWCTQKENMMYASKHNRLNRNGVKILDKNTGIVYDSIKLAAEAYNLKPNSLQYTLYRDKNNKSNFAKIY